MTRCISLVIPVFCNEESLPELFVGLKDLEADLNKKGLLAEFVFVDDGSRDKSLELLLNFKASRTNTQVIKLTRNFGAVEASKCGLKHVTGDCFTVIAADLQDPLDLVARMAREWLNGKKFVICERSSRDDPAFSKIFASFYYLALRLIVMRGFPKGGFDVALLDSQFLPMVIESSKHSYRPILYWWIGVEPHIIKYDRQKRRYGKSKWTFTKKLNLFTNVFFGFSALPIRLISIIGFVTAVASFSYGAMVAVNTLLYDAEVPGFAAIVCLISFLISLVIIMLGILGEYVWRIYEQQNKRPEVVIDEIY